MTFTITWDKSHRFYDLVEDVSITIRAKNLNKAKRIAKKLLVKETFNHYLKKGFIGTEEFKKKSFRDFIKMFKIEIKSI